MKESVDETTQLKRALIALKSLRSRLESAERARTEPIAVVGIGCRLPGGSDDPERFWKLLRDGTDGVRDVPSDRWDVDAYFDPNPEAVGKMYSRAGGFIDRIDEFDAHFFGIAPREASRMDPQQRLLLEVAWEALEDAGQSPAALAGSPTGVFLGMSSADYATMGICKDVPMDPYSGTGGINSVAAGRISYLLGFHGPTLAVDTACSSSLVALHLAVQSLRSGECRVALVGGANAMLLPDMTVYFCKVRAMSAQGRCKTFDASADGYVRGEGCGIVVLKRLSDAIADRDRILAVVRSTAINHDGRSNGLTSPSGNAQQAVLEKALSVAGLEPESIDYVEAHGTGTPLGDPIEVQALAAVLGRNRGAGQRLALGSVKTNIGHLEAAAGVAGLIKVVLSLHNEEIPPHLHLTKLNPHISWSDLPLQVHTTRAPWKRGGRPRRAGISAFGFSGTNAHVIVEESPVTQLGGADDRSFQLLTLSAKTEQALRLMAARLNESLGAQADLNLSDVAFTLNCGRSHFSYRLAIVARQVQDAREKLAAFEAGRSVLGVRQGSVPGTRPRVVFLFTGQGAQYAGMGRRLFESEPVFRDAMEKCDALLRDSLGVPLLDVIYPPNAQLSPIDQTAYTQPALFAIEYSLAQLWQSWGIQPAAVMGHSIGEYVAACVAGVFSLEDGLRLVAARGRLMQALPGGGRMCAVFAPESQVLEAIRPFADRVSIASINGPSNVVISGAAEAIEEILRSFEQTGILAQDLTVSHAFHSPLMEPMLDDFEERLSAVNLSAPNITLISNETGKAVDPADIRTPAYWRRHVRQPVRFSASIETLVSDGYDIFVEAGPSPVLIGMGKRCVKAPSASWLGSLRKEREDWDQLLDSLSSLYVRGLDIAWENVTGGQSCRKVALPTYPFQRQRYWLELPEAHRAPAAQAAQFGPSHPLLGRRVRSATADFIFETEISDSSPEFLRDHKVQGKIVIPAAYYLSLMLAVAEQVGANGIRRLEGVTFPEPLVLAEKESRIVQVIATPVADSGWTMRVVAAREKDGRLNWITHSSGSLTSSPDPLTPMDIPALQSAFVEEIPNVPERYERIWDGQMALGPGFRWAERIWKKGDESFGALRAPADTEAGYGFQPGFLDGILFHVLGPLLPDADGPWLPVGIDEFHVSGHQPSSRVWCQARLDFSSQSEGSIRGDVTVASEDGLFFSGARNLRLRRLREDHGSDLDPGAHVEVDSQLKIELETAAPYKRRAVLASFIQRYSMELLGCAPDYPFNTRQSLLEMGMDSLMATDLRNRLQAALGMTIPATLVFDYPATESIADYLLSDVLAFSGTSEKSNNEDPKTARGATASAVSGQIRSLSDDELLRSLVNELSEIRGGDIGE